MKLKQSNWYKATIGIEMFCWAIACMMMYFALKKSGVKPDAAFYPPVILFSLTGMMYFLFY